MKNPYEFAITALFLVFVVLAGMCMRQWPTYESHDSHKHSHTPRIEEDSPAWDCRTMGNRVCGPASPVATP